MRRILVDSSIWIDYFRDKGSYGVLDDLIANNQVCVNDVILAELLPFLYHKGSQEVAEALLALPKVDLRVDWAALIHFQLQSVLDHHLLLFAADTHFKLMSQEFDFGLFEEPIPG